MVKLNQLKSKAGSRKESKLLGRGIGSGRGKTSGRGGKGQTARSGSRFFAGFEGGQTPLYRRLPQRGFNNIHRHAFDVINIGALENAIKSGLFAGCASITQAHLIESGLCRGNHKIRIKLLSARLGADEIDFGSIKVIKVDAASQAAVEILQAIGISVEISAKNHEELENSAPENLETSA